MFNAPEVFDKPLCVRAPDLAKQFIRSLKWPDNLSLWINKNGCLNQAAVLFYNLLERLLYNPLAIHRSRADSR